MSLLSRWIIPSSFRNRSLFTSLQRRAQSQFAIPKNRHVVKRPPRTLEEEIKRSARLGKVEAALRRADLLEDGDMAFFEKETVTVEKRDGEFVAERSPITLDTREDAEGGVTTADEEDDPMKQRHEELKKELEVMPLQRLKALRDLMKDDQFFLYKLEVDSVIAQISDEWRESDEPITKESAAAVEAKIAAKVEEIDQKHANFLPEPVSPLMMGIMMRMEKKQDRFPLRQRLIKLNWRIRKARTERYSIPETSLRGRVLRKMINAQEARKASPS